MATAASAARPRGRRNRRSQGDPGCATPAAYPPPHACPPMPPRDRRSPPRSRSWVTMTTVRPRLRCRPPAGRTPAPIGSRPAVGSSRNRISGSSASAQARPSALAHAAGQLGRELVAGVARQADQVQQARSAAAAAPPTTQALAPRRLDVLGDRQRAEQGAVLEQHSLPRLQGVPLRLAEPPDVMSEHLDLAALGRSSPRMWRNRTDLPAPEPPTTPSTSPVHLEVEPVHHLRPEAGAQPTDPHSGRCARSGPATRTRSRRSRRTRSPGRCRPPPRASSCGRRSRRCHPRSDPRSRRPWR